MFGLHNASLIPSMHHHRNTKIIETLKSNTMMKTMKGGLMAKIPTLRARAKENH